MQTSKPWDSERGKDIWMMKPLAERQERLAQLEPLLMAALGITVNPDGTAQRIGDNWREIKR